MVVRDFFAVADLRQIHVRNLLHPADRSGGGKQRRDIFLHIICEKSAVRPGIGAELFLIERLQIVQSLLGGIIEQPVRVPLQGGQIVKGRRVFCSFLSFHLCHCCFTLTVCNNHFRGFAVGHTLCVGRKSAVQAHKIEGLRHESRNFRLTLHQQGQRGGHDPPDGQCPTIEQGEKAGGIDAHQPIGSCAAKGGLVEAVILRSVLQMLKALPDGAVLHAGNPKAFYGLSAPGQGIGCTEDQFSLPSGVTGIDDLGNLLPVHQLPQQVKLLLLPRLYGIAEGVRKNGEVGHAPFAEPLVVGGGFCQLRQMAEAPGHQIPVSLQIPAFAYPGPQDGGDAMRNGGLFRQDKRIC